MVGWHHRLNGHGFWWSPGVGDGQGGLACCSSWGRKESDMTELLNCTDTKLQAIYKPKIQHQINSSQKRNIKQLGLEILELLFNEVINLAGKTIKYTLNNISYQPDKDYTSIKITIKQCK